MPSFKTLDDLPDDLTGKKVLVRVDLNVPMNGAEVTDDTRLRASLPTILELADKGAIVLLLSHFGRPKGRSRPDMSTAQLVMPLHRLTGRSVRFVEDCAGAEAERAVTTMLPAISASLKTPAFISARSQRPGARRAMAGLGDTMSMTASRRARAHAHRRHHPFSPELAGRSMEAELTALERAIGTPDHPVAAVVGGAKVSTKLAVIGHLSARSII